MNNSENNRSDLFNEFQSVSLEEWEAVIENDLQSADYRKELRWNTQEGIEALPFYRREDRRNKRKHPVLNKRTKQNRWKIGNPIYSQSIADAAGEIDRALEHGAQVLQIRFHVRSTAGMLGGDLNGTAIQTQADFDELFNHIPPDEAELHIDAAMASPVVLAMLLNRVTKGEENESINARFTYDPGSYLILKGQWPKPESELKKEIVDLAEACIGHPGIRPLCADARTWHNAGATVVQELGLALAGASEYMAALTDGEIGPDEAAASISFNFSVGSKYFLEIAKFRALRLLWKQLIRAYGADAEIPAYLHAETASWNKTVFDPYVNMLRAATEGMSAVLSGVDSLTVHPFDSVYRQPDHFSDRIARNSQIILKEESYFDGVADPAAGSYYIEELTDKLAEAAWDLFREIEQEGGLFVSIQNGTVQSMLEITQKERNREIAGMKRVFVGTNKFTNAEERMADKIEGEYTTASLKETETDVEVDTRNLVQSLSAALEEGASLGDLIPKIFDPEWSKHYIRTISTYRGSQAFEELRLATERHDEIPVVLTLPLGARKWRKARSSFANNFFGCAGYRIEDPVGFENPQDAVQAVKKKQPDIAVLCSSDNEYRELVPPIANGLRAMTDPPLLVLAGYPEHEIEFYKKEGIEAFIHSNCNVLETLRYFQSRFGITSGE